jgi:hypothetical protein
MLIFGGIMTCKDKKCKDKKWIMPKWMKSYENMILNTGGNSIEDLVNDDGRNSNIFNNAPRALICASVKSQVGLLQQLYEQGLLKEE